MYHSALPRQHSKEEEIYPSQHSVSVCSTCTHARHMLCIVETCIYSFSYASMATRKRDNLEVRCQKASLVVYMCVSLLSLIDEPKDNAFVHKGLMTKWSRHINCPNA